MRNKTAMCRVGDEKRMQGVSWPSLHFLDNWVHQAGFIRAKMLDWSSWVVLLSAKKIVWRLDGGVQDDCFVKRCSYYQIFLGIKDREWIYWGRAVKGGCNQKKPFLLFGSWDIKFVLLLPVNWYKLSRKASEGNCIGT